jgi:signal transduction histidine kinase
MLPNVYAQSTTINQATLSLGEPYQNSTPGQLQTLPHNWNSDRPQREGIFTYYMTFEANAKQRIEPQALYFLRLGNRYQIWLNGKKLAQSGDLTNKRQGYINTPVLIMLSAGELQAHNNLNVIVSGDQSRYAGMSSVQFADASSLALAYEKRYFYQQSVPYALIFICLTLGLLSFMFAWGNKNKQMLIFGIGSVFWALASAFELYVDIPFSYQLWLFIYDYSYAVSVSCICVSFLAAIQFNKKWFLRLNYWFLTISIILISVYCLGYGLTRQIFLVAMLAITLLTAGIYFYFIYTSRRKIYLPLLLVSIVAISIGFYDQFFVYNGFNGYEIYSLARYIYLLFSFAIASILVGQFLRMTRIIKKNNLRMHTHLKNAREHLQKMHYHQMQVEKKALLNNERIRMMQDMHDGLGNRLINLKHFVDQKNTSQHALRALINQSLLELKFTVNAIANHHSDISSMLGSLRERLEFTCTLAGKALIWDVGAIPVLPLFDETKIDSLSKCILEVFNNISKHSSATTIVLTSGYSQEHSAWVNIQENGQGYVYPETDILNTQNKGLLGLQERSNNIGMELRITDFGRNVCFTLYE